MLCYNITIKQEVIVMNVNFLRNLFTLTVRALGTMTVTLLMSHLVQAADGVHRHGQGSLQILQAENQWQFTLSLPLDDAFGFEHAPETDEQKSYIRHFVTQAKSFVTFIKVQGSCSLKDAVVNLPWSFHEDSEHASEHEHEHEHDRKIMHEEAHAHEDVEAVYQIDCKEAIKSISVNLPTISPSLVSIDAQWATENGQGMQVITAEDNTLFLQR